MNVTIHRTLEALVRQRVDEGEAFERKLAWYQAQARHPLPRSSGLLARRRPLKSWEHPWDTTP